jgi:hypothetical protein
MSRPGINRACPAHRAAKVAGCTAAGRQKPSLNSSSRWASDTRQSFCAAGIPEDSTCHTTISMANQVSSLAATSLVAPEVWRAMSSEVIAGGDLDRGGADALHAGIAPPPVGLSLQR